jgi:hypothetical protein
MSLVFLSSPSAENTHSVGVMPAEVAFIKSNTDVSFR